MGKYARDLNEVLESKVKSIASNYGFRENGITVEAIRLVKSKNSVGEIVKANDLVKLFLADDHLVVVALYEDAFDLVDEQTQNIWIESLLAQVTYDSEKDTISIVKPEISVPISIYHTYKEIAPQKMELAYYTLKQIEEKKKEEKEAKKASKKKKEE